jgi:hypothetical protein
LFSGQTSGAPFALPARLGVVAKHSVRPAVTNLWLAKSVPNETLPATLGCLLRGQLEIDAPNFSVTGDGKLNQSGQDRLAARAQRIRDDGQRREFSARSN